MKLLFINTKKNWGGIVNLSSILMQTLAADGIESFNAVSIQRIGSFSLPAPVINLSLSYGFNYNPLAIFTLAKLIRKHKIEFVIVNITKEIIFGGIAARLCGIKCVRLVGNELDFERHHFLNTHFVDLNIHPSHYTLRETKQRYSYTKKLNHDVIHCGTEDRQISIADKQAEYKRLQLSPTHFIIGCTGRIVEDKGVHTLIKAFALLKDKIPEAVLVINGKGEYLTELQQLIKTHELGDRVRAQGFAPDCLTAASIYDVAVMPSRLEGFPNTLIEYLSLGKAVVSTPVGGIPEAIEDKVNGLIFPVDDAGALAECILLVAQNAVLKKALEANARSSYLARFTASAMATAFLTLLKGNK
jgi:glycosyltransferase involved in cell wall biosynthesis